MMRNPFWIDPTDSETPFPPVDLALSDPNGLLALGADLSVERLLNAYQHGIFPWYNEGQPILWWSPDPRSVLFPSRLRISRSLRKTLRKQTFRVTFDTDFDAVLHECSKPRRDGHGTWITREMQAAYNRLHNNGLAHSVECWLDGTLCGGLYGVALGSVFFGESMFSRCTDASKVALVELGVQLLKWDFRLIDCQIHSAHLESLGAELIPRSDFVKLLEQWCSVPAGPVNWGTDIDTPETTQAP